VGITASSPVPRRGNPWDKFPIVDTPAPSAYQDLFDVLATKALSKDDLKHIVLFDAGIQDKRPQY
jgi:hypothetical protein